MAMESTWMARLTVIALTITIVGTGIAWLDARHASSGDMRDIQLASEAGLSALKTTIEKERLDRIEFEIEELERNVRVIKRTSVSNQDLPEVRVRLDELKARRERYLRKREELLLEMER
jgi:hypothetical protein